nr:ash family protein [Aeromonas veronii]
MNYNRPTFSDIPAGELKPGSCNLAQLHTNERGSAQRSPLPAHLPNPFISKPRHCSKHPALPQFYRAAFRYLSENVRGSRIYLATAKSVAGRGNPELNSAPTHALAWFFVGTRSPLLGALLAYLVGGVCCVMVARAGQLSGWPVSSGFAGISTPARATAMSVETLVGSEYLSNSEAAIMATIPTLATSKIFTFLLAAHGCRVAELPRIRTVSTTAYSEDEARAHLAGLPLVFISRTPSKGAAA